MPAASVSASAGHSRTGSAPATSASYSGCSVGVSVAPATPSGMITMRRTVGSASRIPAITGQRLASTKMVESPA